MVLPGTPRPVVLPFSVAVAVKTSLTTTLPSGVLSTVEDTLTVTLLLLSQ